jgi:hypothetical protein
MLEVNPSLNANSASHRELRLRAEVDAADAEFIKFAKDNLSQLIELEERRINAHSSLRVFARSDIEVWRNPDGNLNYFVNEVERGPSASL